MGMSALPERAAFAPRLAILSAMPQEQMGLVEQLQGAKAVDYAGRTFWCGELHGVPVVLALSRVGKVAAAITTAVLIERWQVPAILFTGVAGAVGEHVQIGDVVMGGHYLQHDMDASPLFPRFEVPLTGRSVINAEQAWLEHTRQACVQTLADLRTTMPHAQLHVGLIASGDKFVCTVAQVHELRAALAPMAWQPLAVEMEGAACAQVCADYGVPFVAVRTISDRADEEAAVNFSTFVEAVASVYAHHLVKNLLRSL